MGNQKGFTLVELMVVIVIVGILAAVAIPKFTMASHKAKASEFPTVLTQIATAENAYQAENGSFTTLTGLQNAGLNIPNSRYFTYSVTGVSSTGFTATANVSAAFGDATVGNTATIDQTGAKAASADLLKYASSWQ